MNWTEEELEKERKRRIIPALRRASRWWKPKTQKQYKVKNCEKCGVLFTDTKKKFADHIKPVVDVKTGFVNWDTYIKRMFCNSDDFSIICKACHTKKTQKEQALRKKYKKRKKV